MNPSGLTSPHWPGPFRAMFPPGESRPGSLSSGVRSRAAQCWQTRRLALSWPGPVLASESPVRRTVRAGYEVDEPWRVRVAPPSRPGPRTPGAMPRSLYQSRSTHHHEGDCQWEAAGPGWAAAGGPVLASAGIVQWTISWQIMSAKTTWRLRKLERRPRSSRKRTYNLSDLKHDQSQCTAGLSNLAARLRVGLIVTSTIDSKTFY